MRSYNTTKEFETNVSTTIINSFKSSTDTFGTNTCLNYKEEQITNLYDDTNCFNELTRRIQSDFYRFVNNDKWVIILGETPYHSVWWQKSTNYFQFNLGPIFFTLILNEAS